MRDVKFFIVVVDEFFAVVTSKNVIVDYFGTYQAAKFAIKRLKGGF